MVVLCISFGIALADQVSKSLIRQHFGVGDGVNIVPACFDLRYIRNTGAAWGMLAGFSHWLVLVSVAMLVVLLVFRRAIMTDSLVHRIATGLMVGGIVGNLIDRVRLGYVVDFLMFYWRTPAHAFPAFNIADSAICIGVALYALTQLRPSVEKAPVVSETGE